MPESGAPASQLPLFRALVGVGLVCALITVTTHQLTRPYIEANEAAALGTAVGGVLPGAATVRAYRRSAGGGFEPAPEGGDGPVVYAGFDHAGRLVGFALPGRGPGYQDVIELLVGYEPRGERVVGLAVLALRETPGLGERIRSDPRFLQSFRNLDVRLDASGGGLANPVALARAGQSRRAWEVDGISGATVSAAAVARIVGTAVAAWAPALRQNLSQFRGRLR